MTTDLDQLVQLARESLERPDPCPECNWHDNEHYDSCPRNPTLAAPALAQGVLDLAARVRELQAKWDKTLKLLEEEKERYPSGCAYDRRLKLAEAVLSRMAPIEIRMLGEQSAARYETWRQAAGRDDRE